MNFELLTILKKNIFIWSTILHKIVSGHLFLLQPDLRKFFRWYHLWWMFHVFAMKKDAWFYQTKTKITFFKPQDLFRRKKSKYQCCTWSENNCQVDNLKSPSSQKHNLKLKRYAYILLLGTLFNGVGFQRFSRSYFDDKWTCSKKLMMTLENFLNG